MGSLRKEILNLSREIHDTKKNPMEILELKNIIIEIFKNSIVLAQKQIINKLEIWITKQERINKLEDQMREINQSEWQWENRLLFF